MMHRILVACGTGAATSTHVATIVKENLATQGFSVATTQCRIQDLRANLNGIALVITTSALETDLEVPVFNGVPFLTGIGAAAVIEDIANVLRGREADV